jgi:hypothetical protein
MKKRKEFFARALALTMAASMPFTMAAPAWTNTGIVFAAEGDTDVKTEGVYVLMNIPYADFYKADVNNDVDVDVFTSATKSKTKGSLAAGSYHKADGSEITGVTFPVKLGEGVTLADLADYTQVLDSDSLTLTTSNRGQTETKTYTGQEVLFERDSYSYYVLSSAPSYYKVVTKDADGKLSFGEVKGDVTTVSGVEAELSTESSYGDYELTLDGFDEVTTDDAIYGVIITTAEGDSYGLRHIENIWRVTDLAWSTGFTTSVHNCPTSSAHYESMMGQTITKVTYYTSKGIYEIPLDETYVPVQFSKSASVADALVTAGKTTITLGDLPDGYIPEYNVNGLDMSVLGNTLSFSNATKGSYKLTITDKSKKYAPITASFTLNTADMPATYNGKDNAPALTAAEGFTEDQLKDFISNITSVSVDGKAYAASGKGATTIVKSDGTIDTTATPLQEAGTYTLKITATGYENPLEFKITTDGVYVLMNIPYAEFYKADVNNSEPVDAFTSATLNKTRTYSLAAGSYHVNSDGSDITGVTFPVKLGEGVTLADLAKYTEITDKSSVTISVTNRGQASETTYTGKDALFESASYSYYKLSGTSSYYKVVTKNEDGSLSFSEVKGEKTTVNDVEAELLTESSYGDYELTLDGFDEVTTSDAIYGVIITTDDGQDYGLRHIENIWRVTDLAWSTGFTTAVHNCPTSSAHYEAMMGHTIKKVTYYTSKGIYEIPVDVYVPVQFNKSAKVADALVTAGKTTITVGELPEGYTPEYNVKGLTTSVSGNTLSFSNATNGSYTLTITDKSGKYAPITTSFVLSTEDMPATYNGKDNAPALTAAEGFTEDQLKDFVSNIKSVSVNGKEYAASGKGATTIVKSDGTIDTTATPLQEKGTYNLKITSTGYTKSLELTITTDGYKYVYAGLTWAEYWASENVLAAGDTTSSNAEDENEELDKGAFDVVTRATTNHGLHRGSYQCIATIYDTDGKTYEVSCWSEDGKTITLTDGTKIGFNKGTITKVDGTTATMKSYEVSGIKYVPVAVKASDYEAFCKKYSVTENLGTLVGGYAEGNLKAYSATADVTSNTNGLKVATKGEDGTFTFLARKTGSDSGLADTTQKKVDTDKITVTVKDGEGTYGEFLRVDLTGDAYADLGANMQTVRWDYYGDDSTYSKAIASYGTKFAADNWMHKAMGIQLGLTDSIRCQLPEGTNGTGYWKVTVYALGYEDYTFTFKANERNIVDLTSITKLNSAIKSVSNLKEADYTADSWKAMQTTLAEVNVASANAEITESEIQQETSKLNTAISSLVKVIDISTVKANASVSAVTYNGKAQTPTVTITGLTEGTDFTVTYTNNTNVGTATATVTGTGNYTGSFDLTFQINQAASSITLSDKTATYTGKAISIGTATVTGSTGKVTYTYYSNSACTKKVSGTPKNAGTYYVKATVAADANYKAAATSKAVKLVINQAASKVTLSAKNVNYTGKAVSMTGAKATGSTGKVTYTYYSDKAGKKKISTPKNAGTYYVKATVAADTNYKAASSSIVKLTIKAVAPTIKAKTTSKSYKVATVKAKAQSFTIGASANSKGSVSYKKTSGSSNLTVTSAGKVTVKKGTKKGTYTAKVKISAKAKGNYTTGTKTVTVKVTVK